MFVRRVSELTHGDVTPKSLYFERRKFLRGMGFAGVAALGGKSLLDLVSPSITAHATTNAPGVEKRKLTVNTNVMMAPMLPMKESLAENGRRAISKATLISIIPIRLETP
jgi:hypothetical protein